MKIVSVVRSYLFPFREYIRFLWHSKNEHGVQSPFVYQLVTKCFYDATPFSEYEALKNYRKSLLSNKNRIKVTDFGAGSRVFTSDKREIAKIAKTAGISAKRAKLLFRIVHYFKPSNVLEIGTSLGLATSALALGSKNLGAKTKIITLEGCAETKKVAEAQLRAFHCDNVELITTEFEKYLKNLQLPTSQLLTPNFQLVYFDGNHSEKATLQYFELLLPTSTNDSVWIFDDIHWSQGMKNAWQTIQNHPKVTVTIDTFQWGIVFFRKEQVKEHFVIRV